MFSGIKSIFFGYPAAEAPTGGDTNESASLNNNDSTTSNEKTSFSQETSALLEQTLNAATTKFTEQLLPQSPSIEQLQSSSRQLLPTLNEQHEEDETKRKKQAEQENISKGSSGVDELENNDGDDECFNADSWELLDLVEKPEACGSGSNFQNESVNVNSSGILKQNNKASKAKLKNQSNQRQKPKVSFETPDQPDLVRDKPMFSRKKPKDSNVEPKNANTSSNKRKQNKDVVLNRNKDVVKSGQSFQEPSSSSMVMSMISLEPAQAAKKSVLNYRAALSMNLKKEGEKDEGSDVASKGSELPAAETVVEAVKDEYVTYRGTVKRNRPVSTSSWSSDEIDTIDSTWNDVQSVARDGGKVLASEAQSVVAPREANEDDESVISSGFSDCDYGYEGLNDYIMRPKKAQNKKRRGVTASSNWLVNSVKKRGDEQQEQASLDKESSTEVSIPSKGIKSPSAKINASSSKNIKPKKKKLVLSPPSVQSGFLKKQSSEAATGCAQTASLAVDNSEQSALNNASVEEKQTASEANSTLMPPPPPLPTATSSSASGADSSDVADMDESWYVTPPPCFTGSNKLAEKSPAAKEAARENALIENPSIYIPMTTQKQWQDQQNQPSQLSVKTSKKSTTTAGENTGNKQKAIVLKKVGSKQAPAPSSSGSGSDSSQTKRKSTVPVQPVEKKKSVKAWENKFIVTNWSYDEQDDINDDFDNLFEADELAIPTNSPKSKASPSSSARNNKAKKTSKGQVSKNESFSMLEMSAGYESDISIPAPALSVVADNQSELSNEMLQSLPDKDLIHLSALSSPSPASEVENSRPSSASEDNSSRRNKPIGEKKALVSVRPIEPERQPGWQLRKKRAKRRSLGALMANTCNSATGTSGRSVKMASSASESMSSDASGSNLSSARSTPTLIDRISSSIVANLTNLTSGFPAAALPIQARANIEEADKLNQTVSKRSNAECGLAGRRRMTKGYLDRQNNCAKFCGSNRRADRRLKMHTTPNGYSIDRKVQTSFH